MKMIQETGRRPCSERTGRRLLSILLCMVMLLGLLPTVALAVEDDSDFIHAVNDVVEREAPKNNNPSDDTEKWKTYLNSRFYTAVGGDADTWSPKWHTTNNTPIWDGTTATTTELITDATTKTYGVENGAQLRYALEQCVGAAAGTTNIINIKNDIDMNGQSGMLWSGINLDNKNVTINGNGYTIYNLCSIGNGKGAGFISKTTGAFTMKDLSFVNANLCGTMDNGEGQGNYANGAAIVNHASSANIIFENIDLADCLFVGSYYVGGLVGRFDGTIGANAEDKYIKNCSTENSVSFGETHVGSLTGPIVSVNDVRNCYSVGCSIISTGGHSGGLFSCCGSVANIQDCFVDAEVYGNTTTGVFTGVVNGGTSTTPCSITSCFSSGFVEGRQQLGGFIGNVYGEGVSATVNITNSYSTALVGLRSKGLALGGFIGHVGQNTNQITLTMDSCYAAGEVGSTDTDLQATSENIYTRQGGQTDNTVSYQPQLSGGMIGAVSYGITADAAGFGSANWYTGFSAINCYYDKQTTAMREFAIGLKGENVGGNAISYTGITGVLSTETVKSGTGLMQTPADPSDSDSRGFIGFSNINAGWDFTAEDHYPELTVFSAADANIWGEAAALVKAYSKSSTAGVQLETWDYGLNEDTGKLYTNEDIAPVQLPDETYDTVRDIVNGFLLTSKTVAGWDRIGIADSDSTIGQKVRIAGVDRDVLSLKHQNEQWLCDNLTTGIEWMKVTVKDSDDPTVQATRRLRVIPTCSIDAGESAVIAGDFYDHADDVTLLFSTASRMATVTPVLGDTYDVTTGIFPDCSNVTWGESIQLRNANPLTEQQIELMRHGREALEDPDTVVNEINGMFVAPEAPPPYSNDAYRNVSVGFMSSGEDNAKGGLLSAYIYNVESLNDYTGEITLGELVNFADENGTASIIDATFDQQFNGYVKLPNVDKTYLVTYAWKLADGRTLMDAKLVRVDEIPFHVGVSVYKNSIDTENLYTGGAKTYAGLLVSADAYDPDGDSETDFEATTYTAAAVAWEQVNNADTLKSITLTLDFSGSKYSKAFDDPEVNDKLEIPFITHRIIYRNGLYYTIPERVIRSYTLQEIDGVYFLEFDKERSVDVPTYEAALDSEGIYQDTGRTVKLNDVESDIKVDVVLTPPLMPTPAVITSTELNVTKTLSGDVLPMANDFSFTITRTDTLPAANVTMPQQTTATTEEITGGSADAVGFGDIAFHEVGKYSFTIAETNSGISGMTYAPSQTVYVNVASVNNTLAASFVDSLGNPATDGGALSFVNTYTAPIAPPVITTFPLTVTKQWKGDANPMQPESITVQLYQNGVAYDTVTLSASNGWTHTWPALDNSYTWTIDEVNVPYGYMKNVSYNGTNWTIANTYTAPVDPPVITTSPLTVTKQWAGDANPMQPESITVQLYQNGVAYDTVTLLASNGWTHTWSALDNSDTWTVDEVGVLDGYTKKISHIGTHWTITNTYDFMLNTKDHFAYIIGYPDGTVQPEDDITRAEVAAIFFRMLTDETREKYWSTTNSFSDVNAGYWCNNGISTVANTGVINGYPDGTFCPNDCITRAELVKIAVSFFKFTGHPSIASQFSDIEGHWAENYINFAYELGLVDGYPDGSFAPDKYVTRCEAMKIINHVLGRAPEKDHLLSNMITWPDNADKSKWYYAEVQEATNSHEYVWLGYNSQTIEQWTDLLPVRDWAAFEKEWSNAHSAPNPGEVVDGN